jgi:hypothetical protein
VDIHEIYSINEIPASDESVLVLVPIVDQIGRGEPASVSIGDQIGLTPIVESQLLDELGLSRTELRDHVRTELDIELPRIDHVSEPTIGVGGGDDLADLRESLRADVLQAALSSIHSLTSSVLGGVDLWKINDVGPASGGVARVNLGRLGLHEFNVALPEAAAKELEPGDIVAGPERLHPAGGIFGFLRAKVDFIPDPEQPPPVEIMLPLFRLHRPRVKGCEASYASESAVGVDVDGTINVLGMGGGGGFTLKARFGSEYTARGECVETVIPAKLQFQFGKTVVDGTVVASGMRAKVLEEKDADHIVRPVPPEVDSCEQPSKALSDLLSHPYDLRKMPTKDSQEERFTLEREARGKLSVGLTIGGQVPVKFGLDFVRSMSSQFTIRTTLSPGKRYVAYAPNRDAGTTFEQQLEICWTAKR